MKLYAWQPKGHGQYSLFVCAENENEARNAVDNYIKEHLDKEWSGYLVEGWGTDYYELVVLEPSQVIHNDND